MLNLKFLIITWGHNMSINVLDNFSKFLLYVQNAEKFKKGNALTIEGVKKPQSIDAVSKQFFHLLRQEKLTINVTVKNALRGRVEVVTGFNDDEWNALMREVAQVIRCRNAVVKQHENLAADLPKGFLARVFRAFSRTIALLLGRPSPSSRAYRRKIQELYRSRFKTASKSVNHLPIPHDAKKLIRARLNEAEKTVEQALRQGEVLIGMYKGNYPPKRNPTPGLELHTPLHRVAHPIRMRTPKIRNLSPKKGHKPKPRAELFEELLARKEALKPVDPTERKARTPTPDFQEAFLRATLTEINKRVAHSPLEMNSDPGGSWQSY
jgi:hypothetical protein